MNDEYQQNPISLRERGIRDRGMFMVFKYNLKYPYMCVHMELIFYQLCELNWLLISFIFYILGAMRRRVSTPSMENSHGSPTRGMVHATLSMNMYVYLYV